MFNVGNLCCVYVCFRFVFRFFRLLVFCCFSGTFFFICCVLQTYGTPIRRHLRLNTQETETEAAHTHTHGEGQGETKGRVTTLIYFSISVFFLSVFSLFN